MLILRYRVSTPKKIPCMAKELANAIRIQGASIDHSTAAPTMLLQMATIKGM
jgi:hypothetical protein